jgi:hypothetical protein
MSHMLGAVADLGRQYFERPADVSPLEAARKLCEDLLSAPGQHATYRLRRATSAFPSILLQNSLLLLILRDWFSPTELVHRYS